MLKFFRKYNKLILVVGGSILMVIFLLPAGLSQVIGQRFAQPVARIDGREITEADLVSARREVSALFDVIPSIAAQLPFSDDTLSAHWIMLRSEAEDAGLVGGVEDGRGFIPFAAEVAVDQYIEQIARQLGPQVAQQLLGGRATQIESAITTSEANRLRALQTLGFTPDQVDIALARARGVYRMMLLSDPTTIYSRPEAEELGREVSDRATIGAAIYPASRIAQGLPEPTEAQLSAHFTAYRTTTPAEDDWGIGYVLPPAVQIEWVKLDALILEKRLVLDPIDVNKYWQTNRDRFTGELRDERLNVEAAFRLERVANILRRLDQAIQRELARATANLPGTARRKELPTLWRTELPDRARLAAVATGVLENEFELAEGAPVVIAGSAPTWNDRDDLVALAPTGSRLQLNTQTSVPFEEYVLQVQELGGDPRIGSQVGLFNTTPLVHPDGTHYFVRVMGTREAGPAGSIDQVRNDVVANVKLMQAVDQLRTQRSTFREEAIERGLAAAAANWEVEPEWDLVVTALQVSRPDGTIHPSLDDEDLRRGIIEQAYTIDPTRPLEEADAPERTFAMIVPGARGLVVTELIEWEPLTVEGFLESAILIATRARVAKDPTGLAGAFGFDALSARHDFEWLVDREGDDDQDDSSS